MFVANYGNACWDHDFGCPHPYAPYCSFVLFCLCSLIRRVGERSLMLEAVQTALLLCQKQSWGHLCLGGLGRFFGLLLPFGAVHVLLFLCLL